jgi:hypothetical protein
MKSSFRFSILIVLAAAALAVCACDFKTPVATTFTGGAGGLIPDGSFTTPVQTDFPLTVTTVGTAWGLSSVTIKGLTHTSASDLTISIVDPKGGVYALEAKRGSGNNYNGDYIFSDSGAAAYSYSSGTVVPDTYAADTKMSEMAYDVTLNGTWNLRITDSFSMDTGSITGWEMVVFAK